MWPERMYMSGLGVLVYWFVYLPLSLIIVFTVDRLILKRVRNGWLHWGFTLSLALLVAIAPWAEVYHISREAQHLCHSQAGLHVYRVVEAEGFLGDSSIEVWSRLGFKYVESGGTFDRKFRDTMQDGKAVTTQVTEFISRYQSKTGEQHVVIGKYFARSSHQVIDRKTGEILGDIVVFSIYPGLLDSIVIGLTGLGSGFNPWSCGDEPPLGSEVLRLGGSDVVRATLKPKNFDKGESK